jgi:two-component system, chemotaxis family, CheB/CheR fusion protein
MRLSTAALAYVATAVAIPVCAAVQWLVYPVLAGASCLVYIPWVALAAAVGGFGPALFAAIFSGASSLWVLARPHELHFERNFPALISAVLVGINVFLAAYLSRRKAASGAGDQRLAGIVESAMDAVLAVDEHQRIVQFNPAAERMFLCSARDALGSPVGRFIPERFRGVHREHIRRFGRTGQTARAMGDLRPLTALRLDGTEFPIEASISQVTVNGHKLFGVIIRDITMRQRTQEALRQSENRFRGIFENAAVGIALTDAQGNLQRYNRRLCEMIGYDPEEIAGMTLQDLTAAADVQLDWERYHLMMRGEQDGHVIQERFLRKDGGMVWVEIHRALQRDQNGRPSYSINVVQDITDRKMSDELLKAAQVSAEHARNRAEEANHAKDEFLAVLSHELRTPLSPILTTAYLLQADPDVDERVRRSMDIIRRNTELQAHLIDDLLDVTRIARGKLQLNRQSVDLGVVLQHAVEVCLPDIQAKDIYFAVDVRDPGQRVEGDAVRLEQVFWNLLKNSIKFTPRDGCLGISSRRGDDGFLSVEICDSGVGMAPAHLTQIFNPFEQGGRTRQFGGLGLGLTISKAIVEMHGGTITAHSEGKDKGAKFVVRLPRLAAAGAAAEARAPVEAGGDSIRILLVEDHPDTATATRLLLESHGHEVAVANTMAVALEIAAQFRVDLVLSDLGLPDGSGLELLPALRERGLAVPAIALSGYGRDEDVQASRRAGFAGHLVKPVTAPQLLETINSLVKKPSGI